MLGILKCIGTVYPLSFAPCAEDPSKIHKDGRMSDRDKKNQGKVTLDIELKDLVDMVSRAKTPPVTGAPSQHAVEGEELRKAWFNHMLISMEKLGDTVQDIRLKDIVNLRKEVKSDLKAEIKRVEDRISKDEDALNEYKKDIVKPLSDKVTSIAAKLGVWGVLAGFVGSGIMGLVFYLLREFVFMKGGP